MSFSVAVASASRNASFPAVSSLQPLPLASPSNGSTPPPVLIARIPAEPFRSRHGILFNHPAPASIPSEAPAPRRPPLLPTPSAPERGAEPSLNDAPPTHQEFGSNIFEYRQGAQQSCYFDAVLLANLHCDPLRLQRMIQGDGRGGWMVTFPDATRIRVSPSDLHFADMRHVNGSSDRRALGARILQAAFCLSTKAGFDRGGQPRKAMEMLTGAPAYMNSLSATPDWNDTPLLNMIYRKVNVENQPVVVAALGGRGPQSLLSDYHATVLIGMTREQTSSGPEYRFRVYDQRSGKTTELTLPQLRAENVYFVTVLQNRS